MFLKSLLLLNPSETFFVETRGYPPQLSDFRAQGRKKRSPMHRFCCSSCYLEMPPTCILSQEQYLRNSSQISNRHLFASGEINFHWQLELFGYLWKETAQELQLIMRQDKVDNMNDQKGCFQKDNHENLKKNTAIDYSLKRVSCKTTFIYEL